MLEVELKVKHISEIIFEEYLKPNNVKHKEMSRMMGMLPSMYYSIMNQNRMPNVKFFTMLSIVTGKPASYWTDLHSKWLVEQVEIIAPNIRKRIHFDENKIKVPRAKQSKLSDLEESFFGHGVNVPNRANRRDPNDKKRTKRGVETNDHNSICIKTASVNNIFKGKING